MSSSWAETLPVLGIAMHVAAAVILFTWIVLPRIRNAYTKHGALPGPAFWLPLIGETPQLFQSPFKYMWNRWLSYGGIFRTSLLGHQVYVVGSQDVLRSVWSDEEAFEFYVPGKTFSLLLTDVRHMRVPEQHALFRRRLGQALSPAAVSAHLLGPMTELMRRHLDEWGQRGRVELYTACEELSMDVALEVVTGHPLPPAPADKALVRRLFRTVLNGLYGLPVVLPGTAIYKALAARRRLMQLLWPLVEAEAAEVVAKIRRDGKPEKENETDTRAITAADSKHGGDPGGDSAGAGGGAGGGARPMRMLEAQIASALAAAGSATHPPSDPSDPPHHHQQPASTSTSTSSLPLSPEQLFERALGTVIAVDETSRHLFFSTITATALAPEVRQRLEDEQRQVMRKHGNELSYTVLGDMPYMDAVVKETLRLLPSSIGGFRIAKRDVQLGASGVVIPRGGILYWSTHLMHCCDPAMMPHTPAPEPPVRTATRWFRSISSSSSTTTTAQRGARGGGSTAAAHLASVEGRRAMARGTVGPTGLPAHLDFVSRFEEAFRPERWLSEETRPRQWAVFGGGGHLCLGQHVALAEAKLLMSMLLRRFDFRLEDPALLSKATLFPGPKPRKGTDGLLLMPRILEP